MTAQEIIKHLNLEPHPEGGWFKETWRDDTKPRAQGTAIYFLLEEEQSSHWHRVDAAEMWHHYAGGALHLDIREGGETVRHRLGPELMSGEAPQILVPKDAWQRAEPVDGWALVGCTVTPGFEFSGFELAPPDWAP